MRKKVLRAALVAVVVAVAGYGVCANQTEEPTMSDIMLENVEALATGESTDLYDRVDKIVTEITDPLTGEERKVITIVCDGVGSLECK